MSQQIAVRLPEELVQFLDGAVAAGEASSRAAVISRALEREQRRVLAERDAAILAEQGGYPDLDAIIHLTAYRPLDLD